VRHRPFSNDLRAKQSFIGYDAVGGPVLDPQSLDAGRRNRSFDLPASVKKRGYLKKSDTPARSFALCAQDGFRAETNK
jgi:hypothetical protein